MFMSFVAGLVFGIGSGMFEKTIAGPLRRKMEFSDSEISILSFAGLMIVAAIIVSAMNFDSSAFWLVLGGAIGAFGIRSFGFGKAKMEERRLAAQADASEMADAAEEFAADTKEALADAKDAVTESVQDVVDDAKDAVKSTSKKAKRAAKKAAEPA